MAGQFTGMDIDGVRQLSILMKNKSDEIRNIMQQLSGSLDNTQWVGADRERFKSDWASQHVASMNKVCQGLDEASTLASKNADEQQTASN